MVERRPWLNLLSHAVLLLGVAVVAFPVYLTFVAASHTAEAIVQAPMPLLPGGHFWDSIAKALSGQISGPGSKAPVAQLM